MLQKTKTKQNDRRAPAEKNMPKKDEVRTRSRGVCLCTSLDRRAPEGKHAGTRPGKDPCQIPHDSLT